MDSEVEEFAKEKIRAIAQVFFGDFAERVAVLGAFDTWPYIDYISRLLVANNYVAVTSRYIYRKINGRIMRTRTQEHPGFATKYHLMAELLDQIISDCASAIINFSVSAAHFIETDWCYKKSKKTLGIAYVRAISGLESESCENLEVLETEDGFYSTCNISTGEVRTVWDCMKSSAYCPFIRQEISKNVIEYFFRGRDMEIAALEDVGVLRHLLADKYPALTVRNPRITHLNDDMAKDDEVIFTRDTIYFIAYLEKLSKRSYIDRLSPIKMHALLEKIPGWSDSMASNRDKTRRFILKNLKGDELINHLKMGFVDVDRVGSEYHGLAVFLRQRKYLELKRIGSLSGFEAILVKMTPKGKRLAKLYNALR